MNNIKYKILDYQQYEHLTIDSWSSNEMKNILNYKELYDEVEKTYYYIKKNAELPTFFINYSVMENSEIKIHRTIISKSKDEFNINKLYEISLLHGFMFFNQSVEGEKFWEENRIVWTHNDKKQ